jgi:hypothetical protein
MTDRVGLPGSAGHANPDARKDRDEDHPLRRRDRTLHYGTSLANTLAYMLDGFRGWQCYGLVRIHEAHNFGVEVEGVPMCAIPGSRHQPTVQADDDPAREQAQIDAGLTAILVFLSSDDSSQTRRMTPEAFDSLVLFAYRREPEDLF